MNSLFTTRSLQRLYRAHSDWLAGRTMSSFDPMAAAIDWLDAYRAKALSIVDIVRRGRGGGMRVRRRESTAWARRHRRVLAAAVR